jgi:PAS domain S-box-containing protein
LNPIRQTPDPSVTASGKPEKEGFLLSIALLPVLVAGGWGLLERLRPGHGVLHLAVLSLASSCLAVAGCLRIRAQRRRAAQRTEALLRISGERLRSSEALAAANERFAQAFHDSGSVLIFTDANGDIEWVNPAFTDLTGYTLPEVVGRRPGRFLQGPGTDPETVATLREAIRTGRPFRGELLNYAKSGRVYWIRIDVTPLRDSTGRLLRYFAVQTDITARRLQEREQGLGHQKLSQILDSIPGVVLELFRLNDGTRGFSYLSEGLLGVCGLEPAAVLRDPSRFFHCVHPSDLAALDESLVASAAEGGSWRHGFRVVHPTRGTRSVAVHAVARLLEHGECRWTGILTDLTTEVERVGALSRVLEEVQEIGRMGVWKVALPGEAAEVSRMAGDLLGLDPAGTPGWKSRLDSTEPGERAAVLAAWEEGLKSGHYGVEYSVRVEGRQRRIRETGRRGTAAPDSPDFMEGMVQELPVGPDESDSGPGPESRRLRAQRLELLGMLSGGIAHDFNNLLTGVRGFVELGRGALPMDSEVRPWLESALKGTDSARDLVRCLLAFVRRTPDGPRGILDLARVVQQTAPLLSASLPANVSLKLELEEGCGVEGHIAALQLVVMNLCIHAAQAVGEHSGEVVLRVRGTGAMAESAGNAAEPGVLLAVTDNARRIETPGEGGEAGPLGRRGLPDEGTGLGLSVAREILQGHGGEVAVTEIPGGGTTRVVQLRRVFLPTVEPVAALSTLPISGPATDSGNRPRVIAVVDDETRVRFLLKVTLRRLGHVVRDFDDARDLLACLVSGEFRPELVITDLAMPGMTGAEFLEKVRAVGLEVPFIAMSGDASRFDPARLSALGRVVHLGKPFSLGELNQAITEVLKPG